MDDGIAAAAIGDVASTKKPLTEYYKECRKVVRVSEMDLSPKKVAWIGFGKKRWGKYYPSGNSLHNYARDICHHGKEHISESKLPE